MMVVSGQFWFLTFRRKSDTGGIHPGWPDEFAKKVVQNVAQPMFAKINTLIAYNNSPGIWASFVIKKYPK
jgi:hypothetical protein